MAEDFNLPHWNIRDPLKDPAVSERMVQIHENFEELVGQTAKRLRAMSVQPPNEALAEVTTTSSTFASLSGGPSVTVACREGLMIAVLLDLELKVAGGQAEARIDIDGVDTGILVSSTQLAYERKLSNPGSASGGELYPVGMLLTFPASSTSHVIDVKYAQNNNVDTAYFKNRRLWAWVL